MTSPLTRPRPLHKITILKSITSRSKRYDHFPISYIPRGLAEMEKEEPTNQPLNSGAKMVPPGLLPFYKEACKDPQADQVNLPEPTSRPKHLFEVSLSALNNYCGSVCTKLQVDHNHDLPYLYRSAYQDDFPFIMKVYKIVVRLLDYISAVVRLHGTTRDNMADLADALITALTSLEETLRLESLDGEKVWRVKLKDMLDFLVDPNNRDILRRGKEEISILHNSLSMCALHVLPSTKPTADKGVSSGSVGSCS